MKQFLKYTLASFVGVLLASFFVFIIGVIITLGVVALAATDKKEVSIEQNSILHLNLNGTLVERSEQSMGEVFASFSGEDFSVIGLNDLLQGIASAKTNPNIKGIYIEAGYLDAGVASLEEIRNALLDFKKSGKFIIAYGDNYTQGMYYVASVADKVLMNPLGMLELKGISAQTAFFKGALDNLGIDIQVVKVGTYKSAVEPFTLTKMSAANRQQVGEFTQSIWKQLLTEISASRGISTETLNGYADEMLFSQPAEKDVEYGLIDSLVYTDGIKSVLEETLPDYKLIKINTLLKESVVKELLNKDNSIAVVYAVGDIDLGTGDEMIRSSDLAETLADIRKDAHIKAVVLRINSPGGSAFGAEQVWHELDLLKKEKPVIASMGDYAASGGYYMASAANEIVAQPTTITGSIGIFGLIPNTKGLTDKLGINFETVNTNKHSDVPSITRAFTPEERNFMQQYVNNGYELFVKRCADGRGTSVDAIKKVAEGHVWTGTQALKIGLVDTLGSLNTAIAIAAEKAQLKDYELNYYPKQKPFWQQIMTDMSSDLETEWMKISLKENYKYIRTLQSLAQWNGIQARFPYELEVK